MPAGGTKGQIKKPVENTASAYRLLVFFLRCSRFSELEKQLETMGYDVKTPQDYGLDTFMLRAGGVHSITNEKTQPNEPEDFTQKDSVASLNNIQHRH